MEDTKETRSAAVPELPLKSMAYSGSVDGSIANLELRLSYDNKLTRPIEPIFTFPLPPEASVLGVEVRAGNRIVQSELKRREEARQDYDQAVSAGHQAGLLEQQRDNIFTMSVGGIEPGEQLEVRVKYNHPVDWQNGGGRFIVPLVVAPHFIPGQPLERSRGLGFSPDTDLVPDASLITPHVASNPDEITYSASVHLKLTPGFEARVGSPSHDGLMAEQKVARGATLDIDLDNLSPDRDLTITYQTNELLPLLKTDKTVWKSGADQEEFVLLQIAPGQESKAGPRQIVFCLDTSGSMQGLSIQGLRSVLKKMLGDLAQSENPEEIAIVEFNSRVRTILPMTKLHAGIDLDGVIAQLRADGSTEIQAGIEEALGAFGSECPTGVSRSIVLATDGQSLAIDFGSPKLGRIPIHCVGLGTAVDQDVLKRVAKLSAGSTYWVYPGEDYDTASRNILARTSGPVIRDIRIEGLPKDAEIVGGKEVFAGQPALLAIRCPGKIEQLKVMGTAPDGRAVGFQEVHLAEDSSVSYAHTTWAKMRLREMADAEDITVTSLKYGVLARTTSFVSVLLRERPGDKPERLEIPVSLPHGWEMEEGWSVAGSRRSVGRGAAMRMDATLDFCPSICSLDAGDSAVMNAVADLDEDPALGYTPSQNHRTEPTLLSDLREFLDGVKQSRSPRNLQSSWEELIKELKEEQTNKFVSWNPEQKAALLQVLAELRGYGFKTDIPQELRERPASAGAFSLWKAAQRFLGINIGA